MLYFSMLCETIKTLHFVCLFDLIVPGTRRIQWFYNDFLLCDDLDINALIRLDSHMLYMYLLKGFLKYILNLKRQF